MRPIAGKILVEPFPPQAVHKSGLIIPDSARTPNLRGIVRSIGIGVDWIEVGSTVMYHQAGYKEVNGQMLLTQRDVICQLSEDLQTPLKVFADDLLLTFTRNTGITPSGILLSGVTKRDDLAPDRGVVYLKGEDTCVSIGDTVIFNKHSAQIYEIGDTFFCRVRELQALGTVPNP